MTQKTPERIWVIDNPYTPSEVVDYPIPNHPEYLRADHALAIVAAERDSIAKQCQVASQQVAHELTKAVFQAVSNNVRARTNEDAQAALERRDARIRNEALAQAWTIADQNGDVETASALQRLITEDQSDE